MGFSLDQALIVMPAKDEETVIAQVIAEVMLSLPAATVLVVNDGSTDRTSEIARASGAITLDLPFNLGVGGAMRLGFKYASLNKFPVMIQLDSDGQHNPKDVPRLIEALKDDIDVVIGARFAGEGSYTVRGPRAWAMKLLSLILSRVVGEQLSDTTSGFKAHGPRAIALYKDDFPAEYLGDTVEALILGHRSGLRFAQLPVGMRERSGGTPSQNSWKSALYLGRVFMALFLGLIQPGRK